MFTLPFSMINPVAIAIGPLKIHWYGLAYVIGTLLAWGYGRALLRKFPNGITQQNLDDAVIWILLSAIIGGRLGYICFYHPGLILENPWEILMTWRGGMSFHGGLIGVIIGSIVLSVRKKIPYLKLMDLIGALIPLVLFLGRLANFINAEMYGRITTVAWGVIYPNGGPEPRHPSQLYEAFSEGIVLFLFLNWCWKSTQLRHTPGRISGLFLIGYAVFRIIIEYFKEPESWVGALTIGQFLSMPLLCVGWFLFRRPVAPPSAHA